MRNNRPHDHAFHPLAKVPTARRCDVCHYLQVYVDGVWRTANRRERERAERANGDTYIPGFGILPDGINRHRRGHRVRRIG
jgi:hypothetical protein